MEGIPSIEPFRKRHQELTTEMSDPDFFSDQRRVAAISREHQWLTGIIGLYEQAEKTEQDLVDNQDLIDDSDTDEELKEMAQEVKQTPAGRALSRYQQEELVQKSEELVNKKTMEFLQANEDYDELMEFCELHLSK